MGDSIEVHAAAEEYGDGREPACPLLLGTVKTNLGHLESAAGVAGLIKVLLSMKHGIIPKHLNFENPNPNIAWDELPVRVTAEATPWPLAPDRPPRAGISAFSMTGTNAHLIVEGYGKQPVADTERDSPAGSPKPVSAALPESVAASPSAEELGPRRVRMLPLSGKSDEALRELAQRYLLWLDECAEKLSAEDSARCLLSDMAWTAGVGRSHFAHRAGITFRDAASLREGLRAIADSGGNREPQMAAQVAFAYAGESCCRVGMGRELYESEPVARAVLDHCDGLLRLERGTSLLDVMFGRSGSLEDSAWSQPAVFALGCALTALWSSIGLRPGVVFGADAGEIVAAYTAGVFTLEEGLRFAARRGALMEALPGGEAEESALEDLETALQGIVMAAPSLTMVNQVTGRALGPGETLDGAYWRMQVREPAKFERCMETLAELGVNFVVEVGAYATLVPRMISIWPETVGNGEVSGNSAGTGAPLVLSSLKQPSESDCGFVEAVAEAYESGLALDFTGLFAGEERRRISLPGYPFQRRRFWFDNGTG